MATLAETVYQIAWLATNGKGSEQDISVLLPQAEALLPSVFQKVGETIAGDERKRSILKRNVTLTFANGSATVPGYVLTQYLEDSTFIDSADLTKTYSWARNWNDFIDPSLRDPPWSNLGYYCALGSTTLQQTEPGELYEFGVGESGTRILNIPCVPFKPADEDDDLDVSSECLSEIYDVGAAMLRGQSVVQAGTNT